MNFKIKSAGAALLFSFVCAPVFAEAVSGPAAESALFERVKKGSAFYSSLHDYECAFQKTEISKDEKTPETETIFMKFWKPWKIYMKWQNTRKKGLEVFYERGKHDGKLVIHKPGLLLGMAPVIFLDQKSPWVRQGSASYNIEDAGIGTFLEDFEKAVKKAAEEKKLKVSMTAGVNENGFSGDRFETVFEGTEKGAVYFAQKINVLFDAKNSLPVHMELYGWDGQKTGTYSYRELRLNSGDSPSFIKAINRHLFRVYSAK